MANRTKTPTEKAQFAVTAAERRLAELNAIKSNFDSIDQRIAEAKVELDYAKQHPLLKNLTVAKSTEEVPEGNDETNDEGKVTRGRRTA